MDIDQIFRICLPQDDLESVIVFWGLSSNNCCHGKTFKVFWVLTFVGIPQPKPMHGFSPNFQDMLTETGSTAEFVLEGIRQHLLPCQCFKYISVKKILIN